MKRVLACGDFHCGHFAGLTPPRWQYQDRADNPDGINRRAKLQRDLWDHFVRSVRAIQPIDCLICNGDLIDGKGARSGSTELITASLFEQMEMAEEIIRFINVPKVIITHGTPYHTSADGDDCEAIIARNVNADSCGGHEWVDVNGRMFDVKHKVGSSQVPHGRYTAVAREVLWNKLWAEIGGAHRAEVVLRSHVHYYNFGGSDDVVGMTLPALQGPGSKYGVRQCSGIVHFGIVAFDVPKVGTITWKPYLMRMQPWKQPVIV